MFDDKFALSFLKYCHLSIITTTTQNMIPIRKTVRGWITIYTVDRFFCITCSFILMSTIWIHFINLVMFFLSNGSYWIWYFRNRFQLFYMPWNPLIQFILNHIFIYTNFTTTHHLVTITHIFKWGGIHFLNNVSPIITSPYSDIVPENPPSSYGFIKPLWISLIFIWISNFYVL